MEALIHTDNVCRKFKVKNNHINAVTNVCLELFTGQISLIKGTSGSGKTTLLNLIAGLDNPTSGSVIYRKKNLAEFSTREKLVWRRKNIGFVFQSFALLPTLTAFENVQIPLRIKGLSPKTVKNKSIKYLELVGLTSRIHHRTFELSGGEQQRVAIARALVKEPEIIFADEPTGELDQENAHKTLSILQEIVKKRNTCLCLTSHDPVAIDFSDFVYIMHDGKLVEKFTPESQSRTQF